MSYNLYIRKPRKGKLLHPPISLQQWQDTVDRMEHVRWADFPERKVATFKAKDSSDQMNLEWYKNGQIILGWRGELDKSDPYWKFLVQLTHYLDAELADEYGEILVNAKAD